MKRKIWIWGIIAAVLLSGAAVGGGKYLLWRRGLKWKHDGLAAAKAGKYADAADLLTRFLRRNGGDTQTLREYIRVRELAETPTGEHLIDTVSAIKLLMNAEHREDLQAHVSPLVTQKEDLRNQRHLLALDMKLGRYPEVVDTAASAIGTAASVLEAGKDPEVQQIRSECYRLQVQALRLLHQDPEALKVTAEWVKNDPVDLEANLTSLALRVSTGQPPDQILADVSNLADPKQPKAPFKLDDARFQLLLGAAHVIRNQAGDRQIAGDLLKRAAAHPYPSEGFVTALAGQFDNLGDPQSAMAVLQVGAKAGSPAIRHLLGRRYWEQENWTGAAEMLADVDLKEPQADSTLAALRAIALSKSGRQNEAVEIRAALRRQTQFTARAWSVLLGRILDAAVLDDRQVLRVCMDAIRFQPGDPYLNYYLGDSAARLGEKEFSIAAWRRSVLSNPDWVMPSARLVDVLLQLGRNAEALEKATLAQRTRTQAAVVAMARAIGSNAEFVPAAKTNEILDELQQAQRALPQNEQAQLAEFELLAATPGRAADAVKVARELLARNAAPDQGTFLALYNASVAHKLGLQQDILAAAEKTYGMTPSLGYVKAGELYAAGKGDEAMKLLDAQVKSAKADDPSWKIIRARYLETTNQPSATDAWVDAGNAFATNLVVQRAVVASRAAYRNHKFMIATIDRLQALTSETALGWRIALARLQTEFAENDKEFNNGAKDLNALVRANPSVPEIHVLLARALVHLGRNENAIEHLTQAASVEPNNVPLIIELANLLQVQGNNTRMLSELDRIVPHLSTTAQRRQVALLLGRQGSVDKAIAILTQSGDEFKSDPLLAELYQQTGDLASARRILESRQANPDLQTIQLLVWVYAAQGERSRAEQLLQHLDSLKLAAGQPSMIRGEFAMRMRDLAAATKQFEQAVREAPQNADGWRLLAACQILSGSTADALETVDAAAKAVPADTAFSLLHKEASLLKRAGSDPQLRPIVVAALREPASVQTTLDLLRILDENRRAVDNDRLASLIQPLAERPPKSLIVQMVLTDLNLQMGRDEEALTIARRAMNDFPKDPEPARVVVGVCKAIAGQQGNRGLVAHAQDLADACGRWKQRAPEDAAAADLELARSQIGLQQFDSALATLQPYINPDNLHSDAYAEILTGYAIARAHTGGADEAARLLWPHVQEDRKWRMRWVMVAQEMSDLSVGTRWLQQLLSTLPADAIEDRLAIAAAYDHLAERADKSSLKTDATTLRAQATEQYGSITSDPKVPLDVLLFAGYRAEKLATPDWETAERLYRRALALDPKRVMTMNNLAMVLANENRNLAEAEKFALAAVDSQPRNPSIRDTLAFVQSKAKHYAAAAQSEQAAISLNPDKIDWHLREVEYLAKAGDLSQAKSSFRALSSGRLAVALTFPEVQEQIKQLHKDVPALDENR